MDMGIIDTILNIAALLLWISWRAMGRPSLPQPAGISLLSTIRPAENGRQARWRYLAALGALLVIRSFLYWQMGTATHWMPRLELGVIHLAFRSDYFGRISLYSLLGLAALLAAFHLWLLFLAIVNRKPVEADPIQRFVRLHLGPLSDWPWFAQLLVPLVVTVVLWLILAPLLTSLGIIPRAASILHLAQQAVVLGFCSYLVWKYLLIALLLLHLLSSYVYLGSHPAWTFLNQTARTVLRPLRWLPCQVGRIDLTPLVAVGLVFVISEGAMAGLTWLYQRLPL